MPHDKSTQLMWLKSNILKVQVAGTPPQHGDEIQKKIRNQEIMMHMDGSVVYDSSALYSGYNQVQRAFNKSMKLLFNDERITPGLCSK
jgi:hypothetical protein